MRLPTLDRARVEHFLELRVLDWRAESSWLFEDAHKVLKASLAGQRRGDVLHASRTLDPGLEFVIVAFGHDGAVVLGVSMDMREFEDDEDEALPRAKRMLATLLEETDAAEGFVGAEFPPPLSAEEWAEGMAYSTYSSPRSSASGS